MLLRCALLLCLVSATVSAQQLDKPRVENQDQLVNALLIARATAPSSISALLSAHKTLLNLQLWQRLIDGASYNSPSAPALYDLALQVANELRDQRLVASTFYKMGWYHFGQGNIPVAIENYLHSKQAFEEAGSRRDLIYVLADLGTLSIYASDYKKAKEYSDQSLTLAEQLKDTAAPVGAWPDQYGVGRALSNLGNISKREGEHAKAIDYFHKSLALFEAIDAGSGKYNADIIDDLADIGRTCLAIGDHVRALVYLDKAMGVAQASRNTNRMASICNSLGILYTSQRDYPKAIEFFQQGLQLADKVNDRFKQASMLLNIGVAYQFQKKYQQALENFLKSSEIAKVIDDREIVILVGEGIGAVYKEQGKYAEALDSLEKSLLLAKSIEDRTRISELLWRKAEVHCAKGDFAESISSASEASRLAEQLSLRNVSYLALTTLGKSYRALNQNELAAEAFSRAISGIEGMREQVAGLEQENQLFFEDKVGPYHEMVDLLLSEQKSKDTFEALLYAERAKGRVLLDVFSHGRVDLTKAMTDREKEQEARLNRDLAALNIRIGEESNKKTSDAVLLKRLTEELKLARLKYETFQDSLYACHPELRVQRGQTAALTLNAITALVSDKTAFLEYVVTKSRTYLFVLTKPQGGALDLRVYSIDISDKYLAERAREFREMLADQSPTFADTSRQLYDLLVKPAVDQLKGQDTLCILPDGILWDLPFQALQVMDNRYLLEDYAMYYAPSLGVLKEMSARKNGSERVPPSLLAFGNPRLENDLATNLKAVYRGDILAPLPEAEAEVKALKEIWRPVPSRVFLGSEAGKKTFKIEAGKYAVIHLATHGILDDLNPMYSRLVMARADNDPDDDGLLEAREIMQLHLHADLVVLSACQTARGRFSAGEGMVGMSWAFFVAGVPTMVASQWKIDSSSTARLMISFHKHLRNPAADDTTKASALRQGALDVMKQQRYRHPFFWAGFVMIGNGL